MASRIYTGPPLEDASMLGQTLPQLMYDALAEHPNPRAFNQPIEGGWKPYSLDTFRTLAEETALGLLDYGLERGDRVAFYLDSDVYFAIADMGCLIAGMVDVPIYLTHTEEAVWYVLNHAGARMLIVADMERLAEIVGLLPKLPAIETIVVATGLKDTATVSLPETVKLTSLEAVQAQGRKRIAAEEGAVKALLDQIDAHDLATIIYTSGTTGEPKGVMLSHENLSYNALADYHGLGNYLPGPEGESQLIFLPLTHVFARTLYYGTLRYSSSVYFSQPDYLIRDLADVRPTVFATVPRVLEKVYGRILERAATMTGLKKKLLLWALDLALSYELGKEPTGLYKLKLKVADTLVYSKWREVLGGRIKYIICGGAALHSDLANLFAAADITILQGYGLTETSPVITFNRPTKNRAGTVGVPLPKVEVYIADDGEIMTRGPHIMKGYYHAEEKTREVINEEGWFHTGDIGEFTDEGYLRITDRKKDLFKLSTGKYVMPQPLENQLTTEGLIEQAVVVGNGYKYAAALIFPNMEGLQLFAEAKGLKGSLHDLLSAPEVIAYYQELVDKANKGMDHWSTIKRFRLLDDTVSVENGLLTPTLKVKRAKIRERFEKEIKALYAEEEWSFGALQTQ